MNSTEALAAALHEVGWIDTGYPPAYDGNARFILAALPPGWALVDMEVLVERVGSGLHREDEDRMPRERCHRHDEHRAEARRLLGLEAP